MLINASTVPILAKGRAIFFPFMFVVALISKLKLSPLYTTMPKARLFGMDTDKFVGNEFGRAKRGAKPEPHGCGEPIQAMDGNQFYRSVPD